MGSSRERTRLTKGEKVEDGVVGCSARPVEHGEAHHTPILKEAHRDGRFLAEPALQREEGGEDEAKAAEEADHLRVGPGSSDTALL